MTETNRAAFGMAHDAQRWSTGWRRWVMLAGMLIYPLLTAVGVITFAHGWAVVVGCVLVAAFAGCYVAVAVAASRSRWRLCLWLTGAMGVLTLAVLPMSHEFAFYEYAVVAALAVTRLGRHTVLFVGGGVLGALAVPPAVRSWHTGPGWVQALMVVFTVVMSVGMTELTRSNIALVEARAEVARLASEAERARISRDLHDLLGHSLTAMTVKCGLARRLGTRDPDRALAEVAEVEVLSRQALTEVRAAVAGYRDVTLVGELARGRELLRASGVATDLPTATDMVDVEHQELFGWAIREGLTNVARHAQATQCTVTLSPSAVEIRDDGVGGPAGPGSGLTGLRERAAAAGGRVEAGPLSPRGWFLRVAVEPVGEAAVA